MADEKLLVANGTACCTPPEGERFFTKADVARLLKVSLRCVTNMMRRGELPFLKIGGRLVRFRRVDVEGSLWGARNAGGAGNCQGHLTDRT